MLTQYDYKNVIRVQDACNLSGVVHSLRGLLPRIETTLATRGWQEQDALHHHHPLCVMYANKILDLTRGDLQPARDLRKMPGWHLMFYVSTLVTALQELRDIGYRYNIAIDTPFIHGHELVRWHAVKIAELTYAMSDDVYAQAYTVCKNISRLEAMEATQALCTEDWPHKVMIPDSL